MSLPVFPDAPRDVAVELYVLGGWVDITPDVQVAENTDIVINRGRPNESSAPPPQDCSLRLNNRGGKYSPRNPSSPYFGPTGLGRNTPLRVAIRTAKDAFGRTVASGWGTADVGGTWVERVNGSPTAASVDAGVAIHSITGKATYRLGALEGQTHQDVDVSTTVSLPFAAPTGGNVEPANLMLSILGYTDYFMATLRLTPAGTFTIGIVHYDGTVVAADTAVAGLTYTAGQQIRVRFQRDAQTLRAKVWPATAAEPYAWTVEGRSDRLAGRAPGWVGVRSGVAVNNTNSGAVVFSYTAFETRVPRFAGEVSKWPPKWDTSGNNVYTLITASGIRRRLGQGQTPLKSTYLRGNQTIQPPHLAYYPVEEGSDATSIASGIGGGPMLISGPGTPQFASESVFPGSAPIGKPNGTRWVGPLLPPPAATGEIQMTALVSVPDSGENDLATLFQLQLTGSVGFVDAFYKTTSGFGGGVSLNFYNQARTLITTFGPFGSNVGDNGSSFDGTPRLVSITLTQSGGNVDFGFYWLDLGAAVGRVNNGTLAGQSIGVPVRVSVSPYTQLTNTAVGHVSLRDHITSIFTLDAQLAAYRGEVSGDRAQRLCDENSIPYAYSWDGKSVSALMGPQGRATLTDLLDETADVDMGSMYESRSVLGIWRRARSSLYNQTPALQLDYATPGHVMPPLAPVEDDANTRNDVTVTRTNGSSYQAVQTTGPMAVTEPSDGSGIGRYADAITLNLAADTQVADAAGWQLHLGTVNEARYPQITVDLAALTKADPALALAALSVNLDDKITVTNPNLEISPDPINVLARGYTERIGLWRHQLVFNCAPASPYDVLKLDVTGSDKLDSADSSLYAPAGAADTLLLVGSPSGQRWTTSPSAMPIPLKVGGELVTATAIAPQGMSFVGVGAASEGSNAPRTPALPPGAQAGDLLLVLAAIRNFPTGVPQTPPGYTLLAPAGNLALFGKIHSGSETAPTVTFANGVTNATCQAQMAAFRGVSMRVLNAAGLANASAQNIAYPALTVPSSPACVLYIGWKQDDWTSVAAIAGASEIGEVSTTTGDDAGIVWDYALQTGSTPSDVAAGSFVVTGGAAAISLGVTLALDGNCQAFTVTRSGNRVVKPQSSGTAVVLARPATLGL